MLQKGPHIVETAFKWRLNGLWFVRLLAFIERLLCTRSWPACLVCGCRSAASAPGARLSYWRELCGGVPPAGRAGCWELASPAARPAH